MKTTYQLQVYEFRYEVDRGTGILLIAAETELEAKLESAMQSTGFGRWEYVGPVANLFYHGIDNAVVIVADNRYAE